MRIRSLVTFPAVALVLSSVILMVPVGVAGQDEERPVQWDAGTSSDQPLRGADVVRRSPPEGLPELERSWTRVIQGTSKGNGVCSYSLEFYEPFDKAAPKEVWLAAVDPSTCQFEFEIGIPKDVVPPSAAGGTSDPFEQAAEWESQSDGMNDKSGTSRDYASTGAMAALGLMPAALPAAADRDRKMTVYARWEDRFGIDLNKVLTAVKSKTNGNTVVEAHCLHDRWVQRDFWEDRSSGRWNNKECKEATHRVTGETSGHFANPYFPGCIPDVVHVYYDRVWAKVTTTNDPFPEGYYYGIDESWAEGSDCLGLIGWAGFTFYPEEYWKF